MGHAEWVEAREEHMAGRSRQIGPREANGRHQRDEAVPASLARRLRDAALAGLSGREWGTELGRLYLAHSITDEMYSAGRRWSVDAAAYRAAIGIFPMRSASLERGALGHAPDPDSEEGRRLADREIEGAERFFAADAALHMAGPGAERAVARLCEHDLSLAGMVELLAARCGLSALARHYATRAASLPLVHRTGK